MFEGIKCPSLPEIDNGHILDPAEEYYYGDEASVQCYGGFRLQGSAVITCGPDQEFINQPRCQGQSLGLNQGLDQDQGFGQDQGSVQG